MLPHYGASWTQSFQNLSVMRQNGASVGSLHNVPSNDTDSAESDVAWPAYPIAGPRIAACGRYGGRRSMAFISPDAADDLMSEELKRFQYARRPLVYAIEALQQRYLRLAIQRWRRLMCEQRAIDGNSGLGIRRWVWRRWREWLYRRWFTRQHLVRLEELHNKNRPARAFVTWLQSLSPKPEEPAKEPLTAPRPPLDVNWLGWARHRLMLRTFFAWRAASIDSQQLRLRRQRWLRRWLNMSVNRLQLHAVEQWKAWVHEQRNQELCQRIIDHWKDILRLSRLRRMLMNVASGMQSTWLRAVLLAWRRETNGRRRQRRLLQQIVMRMRHTHLWLAWQQWQCFTLASRPGPAPVRAPNPRIRMAPKRDLPGPCYCPLLRYATPSKRTKEAQHTLQCIGRKRLLWKQQALAASGAVVGLSATHQPRSHRQSGKSATSTASKRPSTRTAQGQEKRASRLSFGIKTKNRVRTAGERRAQAVRDLQRLPGSQQEYLRRETMYNDRYRCSDAQLLATRIWEAKQLLAGVDNGTRRVYRVVQTGRGAVSSRRASGNVHESASKRWDLPGPRYSTESLGGEVEGGTRKKGKVACGCSRADHDCQTHLEAKDDDSSAGEDRGRGGLLGKLAAGKGRRSNTADDGDSSAGEDRGGGGLLGKLEARNSAKSRVRHTPVPGLALPTPEYCSEGPHMVSPRRTRDSAPDAELGLAVAESTEGAHADQMIVRTTAPYRELLDDGLQPASTWRYPFRRSIAAQQQPSQRMQPALRANQILR